MYKVNQWSSLKDITFAQGIFVILSYLESSWSARSVIFATEIIYQVNDWLIIS